VKTGFGTFVAIMGLIIAGLLFLEGLSDEKCKVVTATAAVTAVFRPGFG
jgi:hypothetical protein